MQEEIKGHILFGVISPKMKEPVTDVIPFTFAFNTEGSIDVDPIIGYLKKEGLIREGMPVSLWRPDIASWKVFSNEQGPKLSPQQEVLFPFKGSKAVIFILQQEKLV